MSRRRCFCLLFPTSHDTGLLVRSSLVLAVSSEQYFTKAFDFSFIMDKFLIRKKPRQDESSSSLGDNDLNSASSSVVSGNDDSEVSKKRAVLRKYCDEYLQYGFTWRGDEHKQNPECLVCGSILSNQSMVPNKLKRHLESNHSHISSKPREYFERLLNSQNKSSRAIKNRIAVSDKALLASFKVSELIAQQKKPHNVGEELILPAAKIIVKVMFGDAAEEEISKIPLSNNTVSRRIKEMSHDIEMNVNNKLGDTVFALQLDESTDASGKCQLISFVRFENNLDIIEQFLFCQELKTTTTGKDIFDCVHNYFVEHNISWENCTSLCTDGAAALTGKIKGFLAFVREVNPSIVTTHCFLHREALMMRTVDRGQLEQVLRTTIAMINYVKTRPVKSRIFEKLCESMGAEHTTLLLHSEIRWLSKGKALRRVVELQDEMVLFFEDEKPEYARLLEDNFWCAKLAYLAEIFERLNSLNASMQHKSENIISASNKIEGFCKKLTFWQSSITMGKLLCFPCVESFQNQLTQDQKDCLNKVIIAHLNALQTSVTKYFPSLSISGIEWVISPFGVSGEENIQNAADLTFDEKNELLDLSSDSTMKAKFLDSSIPSFWIYARSQYPTIVNRAIKILLPFSTSYLCESAFSTMKIVKSKQRNRLLHLEDDLRVGLSTIRPRIDKLCGTHQAQVSH